MKRTHPLLLVLASATLYGLSIPLAKALLANIPPVALAGLLYLGAFLGLTIYSLVSGKKVGKRTALKKSELPWLAGVVVFGGILAPISIMLGLSQVSGSAASLLLNLEGVATALVASALFGEFTGRKFWAALMCMTAAGILLSWTAGGAISATGPAFIVLGVSLWALDNNFTRKITHLEPVDIARAKCLVAGLVNVTIGLSLGAGSFAYPSILSALIVGTFSYGVSLVLYIYALREWGTARTGAFFSAAPFIGAISSVVILNESVGWNLLPAFVLMAIGTALIVFERHSHEHSHGKTRHTHEHYHGDTHQHGH